MENRVEFRDHSMPDQLVVIVDGKQIGYMGKKEGSPIQCIATFSDARKAEIKRLVDAERGCESEGIVCPSGLWVLKKLQTPVQEQEAEHDA